MYIGTHKLDERLEISAMPIGSLHPRAWRRNERWSLYVVRVDAYTGWSDWWSVDDWYDLVAWHEKRVDQKISFTIGR